MSIADALLLLLCFGFGGAGMRSWVKPDAVGVGIFAGACALGIAGVGIATLVVGGS